MLRQLITAIFLMLASGAFLNAQFYPVPNYCKPGKDDKVHCGISKERTFAAIINTDVTKENLIDKTRAFFLAEQLVGPEELDVVSFDENLSEYKLPFLFRHSIYYGTLRGMKVFKTPVKLYFDARLAFNEEGQIMVTFENFSEESFTMVKNGNEVNISSLEEYPELSDLAGIAMAENAGFLLNALVFINGGVDALQQLSEQRVEFRRVLNESFSLYERIVAEGKAKWLSDEDLTNYTMPGNKYFGSIAQKNLADGKLVSVDNDRWENYFEGNFLYFFDQIAEQVGGEIEAIALDGEVMPKND